jgi:hypothetical protein
MLAAAILVVTVLAVVATPPVRSASVGWTLRVRPATGSPCAAAVLDHWAIRAQMISPKRVGLTFGATNPLRAARARRVGALIGTGNRLRMDTSDGQPDDRSDSQRDSEDARWMTFKELAEVRGISRLSAATLVRRHSWRRQRDNRGHVIALVPLTWATPESAGKPDDPPDKQPDSSPGYIAAFEVALSAVRQAKDGEIAALRQRADTLRDRVEDLQVQVVQLEEEGARLSAQAEAAEARASQAEGELGGERIRAHTLSSHIEGYRADLEQSRRELTAAQIAQSKAETDTAGLRQVDAARRARGRWARLRAAWRGE